DGSDGAATVAGPAPDAGSRAKPQVARWGKYSTTVTPTAATSGRAGRGWTFSTPVDSLHRGRQIGDPVLGPRRWCHSGTPVTVGWTVVHIPHHRHPCWKSKCWQASLQRCASLPTTAGSVPESWWSWLVWAMPGALPRTLGVAGAGQSAHRPPEAACRW